MTPTPRQDPRPLYSNLRWLEWSEEDLRLKKTLESRDVVPGESGNENHGVKGPLEVDTPRFSLVVSGTSPPLPFIDGRTT